MGKNTSKAPELHQGVSGLNLTVVRSDQTPNARTMTAVTILANTKNTVYTFASNPNLDVSKNDRCSEQS